MGVLRRVARGAIIGALALVVGALSAAAAVSPSKLGIVEYSTNSVTVGWRGVDGATGYRVYRDGVVIETVKPSARVTRVLTPSYRPYLIGIGALTPEGEWLSTMTIEPRWKVASASEPSSPVRAVHPGESIDAAVELASPGDTVRVHAGTYPRVTLAKTFARQVVIEGEPGTRVAGFTISGGGVRVQQLATTDENRITKSAHDVTFHGVSATVPTGVYLGPSCWYIRGAAQRITIQSSVGRGGWDVVKLYAEPPALARDIFIRDSNLSGAWQDIIHVDGAVDMTVEHNIIHDPIDSPEHNDGIQSQHSERLSIVRNTFTWPSPAAGGGPNQAIILGNVPELWPERKVVDTYVAGNLVHHWTGGRPLILNGTDGTDIVNNTFVDSGDGVSITVAHQGQHGGQNPGLEIWNNILRSVYVDAGAMPPSFFSTNLITHGYRGMNGKAAIASDPRFVDARYRLSGRSPARDRALNRPGTPWLSLDGSRRSGPRDLGVW